MLSFLHARLHAALREGKDIFDVLAPVARNLRRDDAAAFCRFLADLDYVPLCDDDNCDPDPPLWFCRFAIPFAGTMDSEVRRLLLEQGVPELWRLCGQTARRLEGPQIGLWTLGGALMEYPSEESIAFLKEIVHRSLPDDVSA